MTALAVKSTVALMVALVIVLVARRTRASARHMVLAAVFAFLLLLPVADRFMPAMVAIPEETVTFLRDANTIGGAAAFRPPAIGGLKATAPGAVDWRSVYIAGSALLLAWLALGIFRLRRLASKSEVWLEGTARMNEIAHEANIRRPALVVLSDATNVPLTFGFRTSTIVLPRAAREWDASAIGRALRHELEHVRREDWVLQLLARAACALYWPNPLVWGAWRRFCFEAERACDDAVVATFEGAEDYAGQLVALARDVRRTTMVPALGMASRSRLSARVAALLDRSQPRGPHSRVATAFAVAITLLFLVTVAPARLIAAAKGDGHRSHETRADWSWYGEALAEAGEAGDMERIRQFLDAGIDVNTVARGDGTALIGASKGGHLDLVRFLISRGADVNLASPGDGNPLIAAAANGHEHVVAVLLGEGARIDEMVQ